MTQKEVFEIFKQYFPQMKDQIHDWFPNGKHSVRVRLGNGQNIIFTFNGDKNWCLETAESFINHLKGDKK